MSNEVIELVNRIRPILAGHKPEVQSAAIAELLSTWVLGFQVPGDLEGTSNFQAQVLAGHIKLVMDLIGCQAVSSYQKAMQRN